MKSAEAQAEGGRTAFVLDRHGDKLRELLLRTNGVERTAAYLRKKMQQGYDYFVIDEITTHPTSATARRSTAACAAAAPHAARTDHPVHQHRPRAAAERLRGLRARRLLLRAFKKRARVIALEIYLHTAQVDGGAAPATFRRAADRLALVGEGLK